MRNLKDDASYDLEAGNDSKNLPSWYPVGKERGKRISKGGKCLTSLEILLDILFPRGKTIRDPNFYLE